MKKIKGSLSAIRMWHLVALFVVVAVSALGLRAYQLLKPGFINTVNGFYENADFTVPLLNGILIGSVVLFLILSFLSKNVPAPKLPEGRNIPLGLASLVAAIGFVWDIIVVVLKVIPAKSSSMNQVVFDGFVDNYIEANGGLIIKENGGIFVILELVFAALSVFYFLIFGVSHFEGKATYKKVSILSIAPGCWAMFVLISKLMIAVSFITVSELLFEIGMLVFTMLFFLTFARITSGVFSVNSMWCTYGCGFPAAIFMGLVAVPRGIVFAFGRIFEEFIPVTNGEVSTFNMENVEGSDFSFTHLFLFVFIVVYVISTLGVGFKNSLRKMRSVSSIVLPDDDEVVVKGSELSSQNYENEGTANEGTGVKRRGFTIAPEFKNIEDMGNFFDNDSEADAQEITQPDFLENIEEIDEINEVDETYEPDEVQQVSELNEIDEIDEIDETSEPEENEKDDLLQSIPVVDISFYEADSVVTDTVVENTVAEAVENYEENAEEEIEEAGSKVDSYADDFCPAQEDSQEIGTESLEEITQIPAQADGEVSCEEGAEETEQESNEEINEPDEEYDFELTSAFSEKAVTEDNSEIGMVEEAEEIEDVLIPDEETADEILPIEEMVEEIKFSEAEEIAVEEAQVKSTGGFLELSQMLLDDFDEGESIESETIETEKEAEKPKVIEEAVKPEEKEVKDEIKPEKVKKEKVKKEKIKKEKIKKEKVKKEKAPKATKTFGKKKEQADIDEPLTIVSLADLRNKKEE